ncbi:MAG: hypothetical protein ACT4QB_10565 [Gammaproteobacteria bacterium]
MPRLAALGPDAAAAAIRTLEAQAPRRVDRGRGDHGLANPTFDPTTMTGTPDAFGAFQGAKTRRLR